MNALDRNSPQSKYLNKDILLVDFFDTCVTRSVHPEYIKYLWAGKIREVLGLKIQSDEVYKIRAAIEYELCIRNKNTGHDDDFHFPEFSKIFYEHISKNYRELNSLYSQDEFINLSSKVELDLEFHYQILLTDMIDQLRAKKESGEVLILVSDFYLSKDEFIVMLDHHNIADLFSEIYISSEYLKNKRSGRIFDIVINECGLDPSRTTMIGDNIHSDYECPKSKGLNAIHLDKSEKKRIDEELFTQETSLSITSQRIWDQVNKALQSGPIFSNITLTFYSFTNRLYRKLREDNVKDVFFLSREGEFLKKIFDYYQESLNVENPINTHYFLASRKSTFLPSLRSIEEEDFEMLFRQYVKISGKEFLLSLNFDEIWVDNFKKEFEGDLETRDPHFPTSAVFLKIINTPLFRNEYERRRIEQKNLFLSYINSFGAKLHNREFSLVDVGWKGTMQDNIRKLIPDDINIHAYYLGLVTNPNLSPNNKKEGMIFSPLPAAKEYGAWIFANTLTVYEVLLGASHGSATEYFKDSTGSVSVSLTAHPFETQLYKARISPLLDSYYEIFKELCSIFSSTHFEIDCFDRMIAEFHAQMVLLPKKEEMEFIETISHFENFGVFEFSEFKKTSVGISTRIVNLIRFIKNPHKTLIHSMWPAITLRKLGLGFLQHFYGWYQFKLAFDNNQSKAFRYVRYLWKI